MIKDDVKTNKRIKDTNNQFHNPKENIGTLVMLFYAFRSIFPWPVQDQWKIKKSLKGSLTDITERSRGDKRGLGGSRVADDAVSELRDRVEYEGGGAIGRRVSYHTLKDTTDGLISYIISDYS